MSTMYQPTTTHALRLYTLAHEKAVKNVGEKVFAFQNDQVKHALVAVEIIHVVNAQDESMDGDKFRALLFDLTMLNSDQYGIV